MQLLSLLQSPARTSTKLCGALLELGWEWSKIKSTTGLSERTIRRARREIDLGAPAQVGQLPAQVGQVAAHMGQSGPGGPGNQRAPVLSIDKLSLRDNSTALPFEAEVHDLNVPPTDLLSRTQWCWERTCATPDDFGLVQRYASRYGLEAVAQSLETAWRNGEQLRKPSAWLAKTCDQAKPELRAERSSTYGAAIASAAERGVR